MSASSVPSESIDERIARLREELDQAERQKLVSELGDVIGQFDALIPAFAGDSPAPTEDLRAAIGFCREAWTNFSAWRAARGPAPQPQPTTTPPPAPAPAAAYDGRDPLTDRQQELLDYVEESITTRGYPPTLREICIRLNISSTNGANDHLRALEKKGYLQRDGMKTRAIRVMGAAPAPGSAVSTCSTCDSAEHRAPDCPNGRKYREAPAVVRAQPTPPSAAVALPSPPDEIAHDAPPSAEDKDPAAAEDDPEQAPDEPAPAALALPENAGDLVRQYLPMSWKIAHQLSYFGELEDVHATALGGLLYAISTYKPESQASFNTWAWNNMRWAIFRLSRRGRTMAEREATVSIDAKTADGRSLADHLSDESLPDVVGELAGRDMSERIQALVADLQPRTREILRMRFEQDMTLEEVGQAIGVTRERVRQIENIAIDRLRAAAGRARLLSDEGHDWSRPDDGGRQTHIPCSGAGCSGCDDDGYRWPDVDERPLPAEPRKYTRRTPTAAQAAAESFPGFIHPGRGWSAVDAKGIATHHLCNGTGKIKIKGEFRKCLPCGGTGRRECARKADP